MEWFTRWYKVHLQEWLKNYIAELSKGVIVLLGLGIFRIAILVLKWTGIEQENLLLLEQLHFWITYATIAALGLYSVFTLIGGMLGVKK